MGGGGGGGGNGGVFVAGSAFKSNNGNFHCYKHFFPKIVDVA